MPNSKSKTISSTLAKGDDGTIQITLTIPQNLISKYKDEVLKELAENTEIPGFRKGKAPLSKIELHYSKELIIEKILSKILPSLINDSLKKYKITPIIYPRIELLKIDYGGDWQIRITTCELPQFSLGNYKEEIKKSLSANSLWIPGKNVDEEKVKQSREEKEQLILKTLLEKIEIKIPKILIDEEVNLNLSKLIERLEKLGVPLESYLQSTGKSNQTLREEYEKRAKDSLSLEFILSRIAREEKLEIDPKELEEALKTLDQRLSDSEIRVQKHILEEILMRRKAIDFLVSLS